MLCTCTKFSWNLPRGKEKMKMWKVKYDNDDDANDRARTHFDQKSSFEPSAQVSLKG